MLPHAGMGSTDAQFNALVEDLVNSLDKFKVPERKRRVARYFSGR
jgi:hemoglobin